MTIRGSSNGLRIASRLCAGLLSLAILAGGTASARAADAAPPAATAHPSQQTRDAINNAGLKDRGVKGGISPVLLRAEVMLDRLNISPGVIDGHGGANFDHALMTYAKTRGLRRHRLDAKTWASLLAESGAPVLVVHELTSADVKGPFFPDLPSDYAALAKLHTLGYRSASQKIAATFHMSENLLAALNPGVDLTRAGAKILVADVTPKPVDGRLRKIVVDKHSQQVIGLGRKGRILVAYPATVGSAELPSPSGTYRVKGLAWNPIYYYNPKNFVQDDNQEKLRLPPGPNNPVGDVFIALTKPTYGLHGTPDPTKIGKTASHGCVRMTNWDATALAHLVHRGMVVHFKN